MTKYFNAFYRHNGTSEILSLDEIAHHDNYDKLRKSLYCTGTGCHAQLRFYQQSNGHVYLSKYPSSEHANTCEFFTDSELYSRPQAEYIEQNGGLATSGIERRKREAQNALENYLSPQKKLAVGKGYVFVGTKLSGAYDILKFIEEGYVFVGTKLSGAYFDKVILS